jgi:hypothetical protein
MKVIQQHVENELAKGILRGDFKNEDTISVDIEVTMFSNGQLPKQKLVFKRKMSGYIIVVQFDNYHGFNHNSLTKILWYFLF